MIVRAPRRSELEAFVQCVEVSFGLPRLDPERERFYAAADRSFLLAAFEGNQLVGTFASYPIAQTLPGPVEATVSAICDLSVFPTHRRRGILRSLLDQGLRGIRELEWGSIAVLGAAEGGLHGRFGFGVATWSARYRLERGAPFRAGATELTGGEIALLSPAEAAEALSGLHEEARRRHIGELARPDAVWTTELMEPSGVRICAAYVEAGRVEGCAVYELVPLPDSDRREVLLVELCAPTPDAYVALWRYLLDLDLTDGVRTLERPIDESIRHLLADPRALRTLEVRDGAWLRLVDLERALAERRYAGEGALVLEVRDDFCPWNSARVALEVDASGRARTTRSERPAELALDTGALATCFLGGTAFAGLAAVGRLSERSPGAVARADRLFANPDLPFAIADL